MPKITIELSEEAVALLAERAQRRKRPTEQFSSQVMEQAILLGGQDTLVNLHQLRFNQICIQCTLDLLQDRALSLSPQQLEGCLNDIRFFTAAISKNLDSVLTVPGAYQHHLEPNRFDLAEINLRALVEKVQRITRGSIYFHENHSFHFSIDEDVPNIIMGDSDKLEQILYNLIGNALKFSPDGGEIRLHARLSAPKLILFSITDQGIGMAPEFLPHFGEKFARVPSEDVRINTGTGIGVFLCKNFVNIFAGRLWASSEGLGKGSTVYFTLSTEPFMAHDPEFTHTVAELRRWQIKLSALLGEVETLPREHYRFDATARADFAQLVHAELEQMQAFLVQLEKDHATAHD